MGDERVRYAKSVDPVRTDGRNVDESVGVLSGEASHQRVRHGDAHLKDVAGKWEHVPSSGGADVTYYDRPMLKESVWSIDIPLYYFLGGAAGAALTLGAALQLVTPREDRSTRKLSAVCHWTGITGSTIGAGFLIHDLGRPARFLYMMRVFRPTSPMNMGVWILSGAAPTAITTGLLLNREGVLGTIGEVAGYLSGLFGAALATYTGVLVSNTAIPIWQAARRWMPVLFAASGAATAGSVIDVFVPSSSCRTTQVFGTAGRLVEIVAAKQVELAANEIPKVGEPFRRSAPGLLWKAATALTAASLVATMMPGKTPSRMKTAGLLGIAGSLCLRLAVHYLGNVSARDPLASFHQQRGTH
jgi:formate-dependent nitrite reductase membrane component NrfD